MALPAEFVYLEDINSTIIQDMKYFAYDNFVGRPIKGYEAPRCILTKEAALALSHLQNELLSRSLSLKVFDGFRPQMAVDDFIDWSEDADDQKMKQKYYPNINKADFFDLGYLAKKSSHTRGSTVDLTLVDISNKDNPKQILMGTRFDFMDELSHALNQNISPEAHNNRSFLRTMMQGAGFLPYDMEWWHFTLKKEPFPNDYFDFLVV